MIWVGPSDFLLAYQPASKPAALQQVGTQVRGEAREIRAVVRAVHSVENRADLVFVRGRLCRRGREQDHSRDDRRHYCRAHWSSVAHDFLLSGTRRAENSSELSGTDSTLTALNIATSIFPSSRDGGVVDSFNPTTKTQAALTSALQAATAAGNPEIRPAHLLMALLTQNDGIAAPLLEAVGVDPATIRDRDATPHRPAAQRQRRHLDAAAGARLARRDHRRPEPGHRDGRRVRLHRAPAGRPGHRRLGRRQAADRARRLPAGAARGVRQGARQRPRHQPRPRGHLSGVGEVLHRPDRARARRQARPGYRARQRDSSRRAGAEPAHQEQPGADRRARRRQDRDRRGPGPAHRRRRRPGEPARQDRRLP